MRHTDAGPGNPNWAKFECRCGYEEECGNVSEPELRRGRPCPKCNPPNMTEKDRIKEGDVVQVDFNNTEITLSRAATVVATPCGPGDSWIFRDKETGFIHYVSEGCTVSKRVSP